MAPLAVPAEKPETEGGRSSHERPQPEREATTSPSAAEHDAPMSAQEAGLGAGSLEGWGGGRRVPGRGAGSGPRGGWGSPQCARDPGPRWPQMRWASSLKGRGGRHLGRGTGVPRMQEGAKRMGRGGELRRGGGWRAGGGEVGRGFGTLEMGPLAPRAVPLTPAALSPAQVLFPARGAWRGQSTGLDRLGGPAARNAALTTGRSYPPPQSAADASPQKPGSPSRARCRESSTTWAGWRWPWASFGPRGAPSSRGPPAARSPAPRSAPGSPGSWRTPGPPCTGRWPRSTTCWLRGPGPRARRPLRPLLGGLRCAREPAPSPWKSLNPLPQRRSRLCTANSTAPCRAAASCAGTPGAPRQQQSRKKHGPAPVRRPAVSLPPARGDRWLPRCGSLVLVPGLQRKTRFFLLGAPNIWDFDDSGPLSH